MEAQQVQHADRGQGYRGQVGSLRQGGADQQTAVAAAVQGELLVAGDAVGDELFGERR